MSDDTVVIRRSDPTFAYLFQVTGPQRGTCVRLRSTGSTIGRARASDLILDDPTVSNEHARIRAEDGAWVLYDLASAAGTFVEGVRAHRRALTDGDRIAVGDVTLVFRSLEQDER